MIAFYRGKSLISRIIRFINWSNYSHVAYLAPDGTCYEAWRGSVQKWSGVEANASLFTAHTPGTVIDLYDLVTPLTESQTAKIVAWMESQKGKKYDYWSIVHFITRRPEWTSSQDKWFCSELVAAAFQKVGRPLLNTDAWKIYPGMLAYSTELVKIASVAVPKAEKNSRFIHG